MVAANISPPALFRVIEELCPTLLIDEADTFLHANQELRGILNAGYKRQTAFVLRAIQPSGQEPPAASSSATLQRSSASTLQRFSCWCPKILATIGRFPDVLADRCIVIRMQRKTAKEACDRLRNLDPTPLCRQSARFVADHAAAISAAHPDVPAALNDRAAEIWEPLFALADLAGGHWPDLARQAALALTATAQDHNPIGSLLLDIYLLFLEGRTDRLFSRSLAAGLNCLPDRPWAELRNGKPITELFLSQQLRPYGVKPRTLRLGDLQAKGYLLEDLAEIFHRYIPKSEFENLLSDSLPPTPIAPQQ